MSVLIPNDAEIEAAISKYEKQKGIKDNSLSLFLSLLASYGLKKYVDGLHPYCKHGGTLTAVWALRSGLLAVAVVKAIQDIENGIDAPVPPGAEVVTAWSRRVALALYGDVGNLWPWKLSSFPRWQVGVMLDWRPTAVTEIRQSKVTVLSGLENGQDIVTNWKSDKPQFITGETWDPNPMDAMLEAVAIMNRYSPATPEEACHAIVDWMHERRFIHGIGAGEWYRAAFPNEAPPGGGYQCDGGPYTCSMSQVIRQKWGGCWINSAYVTTLLRCMNVPAARATFVAPSEIEPAVVAPHTAEPVKIESFSGRGTGATHATVYCYGAKLALDHGDDALLAGRGYFGLGQYRPGRLTWRPLRAQFAIHRLNGIPNSPGLDKQVQDLAKELRNELLVLAAKQPSRYGGFADPSWDALKSITASDRQVLGDVINLLNWPCDDPPSVAHHAKLLSVGASRRPRWTPMENNWPAFIGTSAATTPLPPPQSRRAAMEFNARTLRVLLEYATTIGGFPTCAPNALNYATNKGNVLTPNQLTTFPKFKANFVLTVVTETGDFYTQPAGRVVDTDLVGSWAVRMLALAKLYVDGDSSIGFASDNFASRVLREVAEEYYSFWDAKVFEKVFSGDKMQELAGCKTFATAAQVPGEPMLVGYFPTERVHRCKLTEQRMSEVEHPNTIAHMVAVALVAIRWYLFEATEF